MRCGSGSPSTVSRTLRRQKVVLPVSRWCALLSRQSKAVPSDLFRKPDKLRSVYYNALIFQIFLFDSCAYLC